ncbi:hypothetical protein OC846_004519 [Tilletia horrida]|uniref:Uncharacterized protein n=1 Tax=Tilletia horrida TaxID=155126 RepID=A0AAN6GN57_9BASI|nr:hypothetical protein OC846_004519 [Tilletia horrida]
MNSSYSMIALSSFDPILQQHPSSSSRPISLPPPAPQQQQQQPQQPAITQQEQQNQARANIRLTKKINARLQLAAALIEADNEEITLKAESLAAAAAQAKAEQDDTQKNKKLQSSTTKNALFRLISSPRQDGDQDDDVDDSDSDSDAERRRRAKKEDEVNLGPAPLPQPKLASQSVIFAPFRDGPVLSAQQQRAKQAELDKHMKKLAASGQSPLLPPIDTDIVDDPVPRLSESIMGVEGAGADTRSSSPRLGPQQKRQSWFQTIISASERSSSELLTSMMMGRVDPTAAHSENASVSDRPASAEPFGTTAEGTMKGSSGPQQVAVAGSSGRLSSLAMERPASSFGQVWESWSEQGSQADMASRPGTASGMAALEVGSPVEVLDGNDEEDDDDMPLGQLQQARLSRSFSQMAKGGKVNSRMSMLSTAETITDITPALHRRSGSGGSFFGQARRRSEDAADLLRAAESHAKGASATDTISSPKIADVPEIRQIPVRRMTRSASDDKLTLLGLGGTGLQPGARPHSSYMELLSPEARSPLDHASLLEHAKAAGLPFPHRPFASSGGDGPSHPSLLTPGAGSIQRPASVGPGTLMSRASDPSRMGLSGADEDVYRVGVLGEGVRILQDPFHELPLGPSPFPVSFSPVGTGSPVGMRGGKELPSPGSASPFLRSKLSLPRLDMDFSQSQADQQSAQAQAQGSLTTRQLQELARQTRFPSSFGIGAQNTSDSEFGQMRPKSDVYDIDGADPLSPGGGADAGVRGVLDLDKLKRAADAAAKLKEKEQRQNKEDKENEGIMSKLGMRRRSRSQSLLLDQMVAVQTRSDLVGTPTGVEREDEDDDEEQEEEYQPEPILRENGKILLTGPGFGGDPYFGLPGAVLPIQNPTTPRRESVDDTFTSPPAKGPLKPKGLAAREPKSLVMPLPLQGTDAAPQIRLTQDGVEIQFQVTPPENENAAEDVAATSKGEKSKDKKKKDKKKDKYATDRPLTPEGAAALTSVGPRAPDGFVLHDRRSAAPLRALLVRSSAPAGSALIKNPLPAKPKKHEAALVDFLTSESAARVVHVPLTAPSGIGRRAADKSTILFRNHLVSHDEEQREGWGWDLASVQEDENLFEGGENGGPEGKKSWAELRAEKKALKLKRRRKKARRQRRALRALADEEGKTYDEVGVEAESPVEDLDHSSDSTGSGEEDTSDDDYDSDDERRWVDANRPAGKLFGKSLLDMAEEKRENKQKKSRFYGQTELEEHEAAEREAERLGLPVDLVSTRSAARSFHDNPLGYNDTRERMQAAFGEDKLYARELAKRREEDAIEAARQEEEAELKRLAEEEYEKAEAERQKRKRADKRRKKREKRKRKAGGLASPSINSLNSTPATPEPEDGRMPDFVADEEALARRIQGEDHDDDLPLVRSRTPIDPPVLDLNLSSLDVPKPGHAGRAKGPSETAAEWFARSSEEEDESTSSDSEDEATRRKAAMQRARLSRSLGGFGLGRVSFAFGEDESDVERRAGAPIIVTAPDGATTPKAAKDDEDESSEDDMPLAQLKKTIPARSLAAGLRVRAAALGAGAGPAEDDSSDEDLPLAAIKAKEHRKKMSMGTLDLDFMAGLHAANGAPSIGVGSSEALPQGSSVAPSPFIHQGSPNPPQVEEDEDSDEDRPLGNIYVNGAEALAAARAAHAESDEEDEEDNRPLGTAYPQAAIIAEQAALIQQLQRENEQARMANTMSMYGGGLMGMPMMNPMGIGAGANMGGAGMMPPYQQPGMMMMGAGAPALSVYGGGGGAGSVISGHGGGGGLAPMGMGVGMSVAGSVAPPSISTMAPAGLVHPKVHQIDNWRHSVMPNQPSSGGPSPTASTGPR